MGGAGWGGRSTGRERRVAGSAGQAVAAWGWEVGGRWKVEGGRWEVGGGRWEVGGGRWEAEGGGPCAPCSLVVGQCTPCAAHGASAAHDRWAGGSYCMWASPRSPPGATPATLRPTARAASTRDASPQTRARAPRTGCSRRAECLQRAAHNGARLPPPRSRCPCRTGRGPVARNGAIATERVHAQSGGTMEKKWNGSYAR